jgi:hypothetical protein
MEQIEPDALDYHSGGVPTGYYFQLSLDEIAKISTGDTNASQEFTHVNTLQELCYIGVFSYFEYFCKDYFASIINIEPELINNLKEAGYDVTIDARHVALYSRNCTSRLGFLLTSRYDFGTAKKINAHYFALLGITPFSKKDTSIFDKLLMDRHLLVHHGGIYTLKYLEQVGKQINLKDNAFWNSKVIGSSEVRAALEFTREMAKKISNSSHMNLLKHIEANGLIYSPERMKAVNYLKA